MRYGQKYSKKHERLMFELKLKGVENKVICEALEINERTFYRWLKRKSNFRNLYNKAVNAKTDALKALIKKALGFEHEEEEEKEKRISQDGEVSIKTKQVKKYYPPDISAIKYLLQNISTFDKELQHRIYIDMQKLENEKFEKWLDKNEQKAYTKLREIYEKENS